MLIKTKVMEATDEQLNSIRKKLLSMRQQLTGGTTGVSATTRASDPLDQAQQEMDNMVRIRTNALQSDLLSDVEKALYKIESGEYGFCEKSGEPIDVRRLLAYPTSRLSLEEQDRLEKMGVVCG